MHERMLDKQMMPSFSDLLAFCGESGALWEDLDSWIKAEYGAQTQIRFPYGKDYGWGVKYSKGKRHICDIFAENGAFTVFMKISNKAFVSVQSDLSDYAKQVYESKYPCGDGGWIRYRITAKEHICDAKRLIEAKIKP